MPFLNLYVGKLYNFEYTNYKGETENRTVRFESLATGMNEYHTKLQWFLNGQCMDRNARRTFAIKDINIESIREVLTPKTWPDVWETFDEFQKRAKSL